MGRSSIFRFKQFTVDQANCPMKINTDGVLLAATTSGGHFSKILDIGTGSGVIALMLAQEFQQAQIDAVEIDIEAAKQAFLNFQSSPFQDRIRLFEGSFEILPVTERYDLIISNPPFYVNSLHNPDLRKKIARHADVIFFEKLLLFVQQRLNAEGQFRLILPTTLADEITVSAKAMGLYLIEEIKMQSFADSEIFRKVLTFSPRPVHQMLSSTLVIYESKSVYTEAYQKLLHPYFLNY